MTFQNSGAAEERDEERDQGDARDGAADVRDRDREERATAGVAEREAGRQRHGDRDRHRGAVTSRCVHSSGSSSEPPTRAARLRLARVQDVVDRVAELAEERERRAMPPLASTG